MPIGKDSACSQSLKEKQHSFVETHPGKGVDLCIICSLQWLVNGKHHIMH